MKTQMPKSFVALILVMCMLVGVSVNSHASKETIDDFFVTIATTAFSDENHSSCRYDETTAAPTTAVSIENATFIGTIPSETVKVEGTKITLGYLTYEIIDGKAIVVNCDKSAEVVNIPMEIDGYPVTEIGDYAFRECRDLVVVEMSEGIHTIGNGAFGECSKLEYIEFPDTLVNIGKSAFFECLALKEITIPESVKNIGDSAFNSCLGAEQIIIEHGVESIGKFAFQYCVNLKRIDIPESVTVISEEAFYECHALADVYYGGSENDWKKIFIDTGNRYLECATIHYAKGKVDSDIPPTGGGVEYKTVYFGSYPQSEVVDEKLLSELNSLNLNWVSYGYYYGDGTHGSMKQSNYMKYADAGFEGNKYRAVMISEYRPLDTCYKIGPYAPDFVSHQYNSGYFTDMVYWFKYEPIEWRILDEEENLLLCETIIDSQPYTNTIYCNLTEEDLWWGEVDSTYSFFNDAEMTTYANDYASSSIRKWLNEDFYNTAFNENEKKRIETSRLDNSCQGNTDFSSKSTEDKVFLLSVEEADNPSYGLKAYTDEEGYNIYHIPSASAYAYSQGLASGNAMGGVGPVTYGAVGSLEGFIDAPGWYLRTAGLHSNSVYGADEGYAVFYNVSGTCIGIRPAINLAEETDVPNTDPTCCEKICDFFRTLWLCIINFFKKIFGIIIDLFAVVC